MKLKLTGAYQQDLYAWMQVNGSQELLTTGQYVALAIKANVEWKDNLLRFRFNAYEALMKDAPLESVLMVWADKFNCAEGLHTSTWKDMNGGEWYGLTAIGPYISHAQDCSDFRIGVTGNFCSVRAKWWHRRWKGDDPGLRGQSTLLYLDDESVRRFAELYSLLV